MVRNSGVHRLYLAKSFTPKFFELCYNHKQFHKTGYKTLPGPSVPGSLVLATLHANFRGPGSADPGTDGPGSVVMVIPIKLNPIACFLLTGMAYIFHFNFVTS